MTGDFSNKTRMYMHTHETVNITEGSVYHCIEVYIFTNMYTLCNLCIRVSRRQTSIFQTIF